jgi:Fe-S oxidoreductase
LLEDPARLNLVWAMRKAGLSLLTGCKGPAKPVTAIEDVAVRPEQLPAYVAALQKILNQRGLSACFYGHAASGLLHVRPVLDMHNLADVRKFREVADETAALVREFKGSLTGEHGVGMARVEYMPGQVGEKLLGLMRNIKRVLDPSGLLNPGKVLPDGTYRLDTHLRIQPSRPLELPFEPMLAFAAKDGSFIGNLEQCNGCGGCRKETVTMCPTFMATGQESFSTRGRANALRSAMELRGCDHKEPLSWEGLDTLLDQCLSCKACAMECPSNVNLPLLKAEWLHARHTRFGAPLKARVFGGVDALGRLGTFFPHLANKAIQSPWLRRTMQSVLGISTERTLPPYARERFDHWFHKRREIRRVTGRGRVLLWDDTFVRYYEPNIGQAAVALLEEAGYDVALVSGRKCCGRPAFSQGLLHKAADLGRHNLGLLRQTPDVPVLFLEPSCYSMFMEEYIELGLPGAAEVRARCFMLDQFIDNLLLKTPGAIRFQSRARTVAIHAHCHTKALGNPAYLKRVLERIPGCEAVMLNTGCCGMAGAFGMMQSNVALSKKIASTLLDQIAAQPPGTLLAINGASCRHQVADLSTETPRHTVEILAAALASGKPL